MDVTIPQYRGGMNTYDYFQQMDALDHKYDPDNGNGRWLRSSARFLVCWVAEELNRKHSVGEGWRSVFYLGKEKKKPTKSTRTPHCTAPPPSADETGAVPLFTDEMEEKYLEFQMGDAEDTSTVAEETVRSATRQYRKPSKLEQSNRTLGKCFELCTHLGKRKMRRGLIHKAVKKWLTETADGRELLKGCDVDPDAFDVDHVWAQSMGGPDVVENFHVMPSGVNSFFRDMAWNSKEKRAYVGEEQVRIVRDLAVRARDNFDWIALTSE